MIRAGPGAALKIRQIKHVNASPSSISANPVKNQYTVPEKNAHLVGQRRIRLACVLRRLVSVSLRARFQRQARATQFARSAREKIQRANVTKVAGQANRSTRLVITHANASPS
jgi:RNA polymerase-interacting CarD/CdnL/TRCF family regulator